MIEYADLFHQMDKAAKIEVSDVTPSANWVSFTDPELAHMGKTETELQKAGVQYTVARQSLDDIPRYIIKGQTCGMVKLLLDKKGKLLGAHILGTNAGELLMPLLMLKHFDQPVTALNDIIIPYPTAVSALPGAAEQFKPPENSDSQPEEEPEAPVHYLEWAQRSEQISYWSL
jgi:pyruvate/2-oxoglutarate dehydrogenase complex dihydrolipoamide dehydrogenase (E3) component